MPQTSASCWRSWQSEELLPVPRVLLGRLPDLTVFLLLRRSKRCKERRGGSYVSRRTAGLAALHAVLADQVGSKHELKLNTEEMERFDTAYGI